MKLWWGLSYRLFHWLYCPKVGFFGETPFASMTNPFVSLLFSLCVLLSMWL